MTVDDFVSEPRWTVAGELFNSQPDFAILTGCPISTEIFTAICHANRDSIKNNKLYMAMLGPKGQVSPI